MRFVITGAPGSGKTSIINSLKGMGYVTLGETATELLQDKDVSECRDRDVYTFQTKVFHRQVEKEESIWMKANPIFFDRGILDGAAFLEGGLHALAHLVGWEYEELIGYTLSNYYQVFLLDLPPKKIYENANPNPLRTEVYNEAARLDYYLKMSYDHHPRFTRIPWCPLKDRVKFLSQV